ncbi:hypothetical protein L2E82_27825 [Cichorium intybus]|uniref:Uncharacterized protein n=1 Tax=Cichorium intybus TaxID=13427 RepID=A0ACB9CU40_CICIN|nr:hypothetical protein L2E82_27825 [Cichorium intybus]
MMALCTTRRIGTETFKLVQRQRHSIAFSDALSELNSTPLSPSGEVFTVCALGKDSELIDNLFVSKIRNNRERIKVLVPEIPTPAGLVESLGYGLGRRVLCPVPLVVGLEEPPVVPNFFTRPGDKGVGGGEGERIRDTVDGSGVCGGVGEERRWLWGGCDSVHRYRGNGRDAEEFEGDGFELGGGVEGESSDGGGGAWAGDGGRSKESGG